MTRLEISDRSDLSDSDQHFYEEILWTRGQVSGVFSTLMHAPDIAARIANVGDFLLYRSVLSDSMKYVAILVTAQAFKCGAMADAVRPHALKAGVSSEMVEGIQSGKRPAVLSRDDEQLLDLCEGLTSGNHHLDDALYQASIERFGVPSVAQVAALIGYSIMQAHVVNAFECDMSGDSDQLMV